MTEGKEKKVLRTEEVDALLGSGEDTLSVAEVNKAKIDGLTFRYLKDGKLPAGDEIDYLLSLVTSGEIDSEYFEKLKVIFNLANIELVGLKFKTKLKK